MFFFDILLLMHKSNSYTCNYSTYFYLLQVATHFYVYLKLCERNYWGKKKKKQKKSIQTMIFIFQYAKFLFVMARIIIIIIINA